MEDKSKKRGKKCFFSDYNYGCESEYHNHCFRVGSRRLASWQAAIPRQGLKENSIICVKHFVESDIVKGRQILDVFYPHQRWRLVADAIPRLNLGTVEAYSLDKQSTKENTDQAVLTKESKQLCGAKSNPHRTFSGTTEVPKTNNQDRNSYSETIAGTSNNCQQALAASQEKATTPTSVAPAANRYSFSDDPEVTLSAQSNQNSISRHEQSANSTSSECENDSFEGVSKTHKRASVGAFEELDTNSGLTNCQEVSAALVNAAENVTLEDLNNFATSLKREIQLPSRNWQFIVEANIKALVCLSITINANGVVTTKSLSINLNKTIYASYNGLPLHNITPKELLDSKQISLFLTKLESFHPCRGVVGSLVDVTANPNLEVVGSRSANCDIIIGKGKSCLNCKKLTKTSKRKLAQIKSLREQLQLQKRDLFVCNKNILKSKKRNQSLKEKYNVLRKKYRDNNIEDVLTRLCQTEREVMRAFITKANSSENDTHGKGIRYTSYLMAQAALLKMKSTAAVYSHLRSSKLLPLPGLSSVDKFIASHITKFGSKELVQKHIEEALSSGAIDPDITSHQENSISNGLASDTIPSQESFSTDLIDCVMTSSDEGG